MDQSFYIVRYHFGYHEQWIAIVNLFMRRQLRLPKP